jgi:hypothetical protein
MRYLRIERHLAAKFGTFSAFLNTRGRLYYGWKIFWGGGFSCRFRFNNCYSSTEMISFIKFFSCHSVFPAAAHAVEVLYLSCLIILVLGLNVSDWFCVDMCWGVFFLGRRRVVFFFVHSSSQCCVEYYLLRCFHIARHLAAKFGTRLAAFSVYVIFAVGGWFTSWGALFSLYFLQFAIFIR